MSKFTEAVTEIDLGIHFFQYFEPVTCFVLGSLRIVFDQSFECCLPAKGDTLQELMPDLPLARMLMAISGDPELLTNSHAGVFICHLGRITILCDDTHLVSIILSYAGVRTDPKRDRAALSIYPPWVDTVR